jgi:hypothetical protein
MLVGNKKAALAGRPSAQGESYFEAPFASRKVLDVPANIVRGTLGLVELACGLEVFAEADVVPVKLSLSLHHQLHA